MEIKIALFRGINVGGRNSLPMRELVAVLETLGLRAIKTYIQSGNAVFQSNEQDAKLLAEKIRTAIMKRHHFSPPVFILELDELKKAIASNPFPEAEDEPKTLHLYFLDSIPQNPDLKALEGIKKKSERFKLKDSVFYLHAPEGIGRSKLAARVEKSLGVAATARNWHSVIKVMDLADQKN